MSWLRRRGGTPEDRFAAEVAGLARSLLGAEVRRLPEFALEIDVDGSGSPLTMSLGNIYQEAQALDTEARASRLRRAVLAMAPEPRPQTWEQAAPRLLPAVRSTSWAASGGIPDVVRRHLLPFVSLLCAIDSEHAMTFITEGDLQAWGVSEDEALRRAAENLAQVPLGVAHIESAAYVVGPDGYVSSWLASGMLAQVAADVGDTVVAVAVDRDHLLLIDTDNHAVTFDLLQKALNDYQAAPRQLSPVPYLVNEAGPRVWVPPGDHPARPVVDQAIHVLAAVEYQHQKARLDELFAKAGADVFVATHTLIRGDDGSLRSWAVWVKQVTDGLLPQVDSVLLGDNDTDGPPIAISWDDSMRRAGASLEPTGYDPPLWRYQGWPDPTTLAALREVALPPPG